MKKSCFFMVVCSLEVSFWHSLHRATFMTCHFSFSLIYFLSFLSLNVLYIIGMCMLRWVEWTLHLRFTFLELVYYFSYKVYIFLDEINILQSVHFNTYDHPCTFKYIFMFYFLRIAYKLTSFVKRKPTKTNFEIYSK